LASASPALASKEAAIPRIKVKANPDVLAAGSAARSWTTFVILSYLILLSYLFNDRMLIDTAS
jgi:hypothetical protein